ncbi:uracil-DNA glycosylase [Sulfurospirillum arcachonense]|uniref:uracil-DNA glycosylase n=1 Tax=Sulfurospirillum arcachonense TaxID=57666 RepID=UPI0004685FE5|nr:uracil-DNA glycosylase [Sulfurospirillum arcachonense]
MPLDVDNSWSEIITYAYDGLTPKYRKFLEANEGYFPNYTNFLNAFKTLPLDKTKYILFGQDPYPREQSATGYAFIDGNVKNIFSQKGFSKEVNRATSLRNFLKMLLLSEGYLNSDDLSQEAIAKLNKEKFIDSINELKDNFQKSGVLLLNIALIFTCKEDTNLHVKEFRVFMQRLLSRLESYKIELILFGAMAKDIKKNLPAALEYKTIETLHPYNIGFIHDTKVWELFKPMSLLDKELHH